MKHSPVVNQKKVAIFIHGLSGSAIGTWNGMLSACVEDPALSHITFETYEYPTSIIWGLKKRQGIQELALGLRTFIETKYSMHDEIVLIGHSLGGLVSKFYVIDNFKSSTPRKVKGIALYAVPHKGSHFANIASLFGRFLFLKNRQIHQLCKNSDILKIINSDWARMGIDQHCLPVYVVGGDDRIVDYDSSYPFCDERFIKYLPDKDHTSIKEVLDVADLSFLILKDFLMNDVWQSKQVTNARENKENVLFDVYTPENERCYIATRNCLKLSKISDGRNVWVYGKPGIGKTASLTRRAFILNGNFIFLSLGMYSGKTHLEVIMAMFFMIAEAMSMELPELSVDNLSSFNVFLSRVMEKLDSQSLIILVEEIPFSPSDIEYTEFAKFMVHMMLYTANKVCWWLSSLTIPQIEDSNLRAKFNERLSVVEFVKWSNEEIGNLLRLICEKLNLDVGGDSEDLLVNEINGSPRVAKFLFRGIEQGNVCLANWPVSLKEIKHGLGEE